MCTSLPNGRGNGWVHFRQRGGLGQGLEAGILGTAGRCGWSAGFSGRREGAGLILPLRTEARRPRVSLWSVSRVLMTVRAEERGGDAEPHRTGGEGVCRRDTATDSGEGTRTAPPRTPQAAAVLTSLTAAIFHDTPGRQSVSL